MKKRIMSTNKHNPAGTLYYVQCTVEVMRTELVGPETGEKEEKTALTGDAAVSPGKEQLVNRQDKKAAGFHTCLA